MSNFVHKSTKKISLKVQELSCTWVPGTLDMVRLTIGTRQMEVGTSRLTRIFGPHALNDLYLRGRAVLRAEPRQLELLG